MTTTNSAKPIGQKCRKVNRSDLRPIFDQDRFIAFLGKRHPRNTSQWVASETGVPAQTVTNWLARKSVPRLEHFSSLAAHYGPEFLHECWSALPWLETARRQTRVAAIDETIAQLLIERQRLTTN